MPGHLYTFCVSSMGCLLVSQVCAPDVETAIHKWVSEADQNLAPYLKDKRMLRRTLEKISELADITAQARLTGLVNSWSSAHSYGKKGRFDLYIVQTDPVASAAPAATTA